MTFSSFGAMSGLLRNKVQGGSGVSYVNGSCASANGLNERSRLVYLVVGCAREGTAAVQDRPVLS